MADSFAFDLKDIRSVTDFQRNAKTHLQHLKKTKTAMVLTVNGSASVVVQDAHAYQQLRNRLRDLEEERRVVAAIHEGLKDFEEGRFSSLDDLKRKHAI